MNRVMVVLIVLVIVLLVVAPVSRQRKELYNPKKTELIEYISGDTIDPNILKTKMSELTNDKEAITIAYNFAKEGDYDSLFDFVDNFFSEL